MKHSEQKKARVLATAAELGVAAAARKHGVTESAIYGWRQRAAVGSSAKLPLPTVVAAAKVKPRALQALTFACPHCGNPVTLPSR